EALKLVRANTFSVLLLLVATYLFREKSVPFSRLVFLILWALSISFTLFSRSMIRIFLRTMRRRGYNLRYALIVGTGSVAAKIAHSMLGNPEYGIELLGCLARDETQVSEARRRSNTAKRHYAPGAQHGMLALHAAGEQAKPASGWESFAAGLPVVGTYAELPYFLQQGRVDQVIVALPLQDHERLSEIIGMIGDSMVDVKIVPDIHEFIQLGSQVEEFDGLPVVSLASTPLVGLNRILKRAFDLLLSAVLLVVLSPVLVLLALLVKLSSRGPVFYHQERVGLDGRKFTILKFRTMYCDAELNGAQFAVRGDPRVTPLGRVLRRLNLAELPQLLNVFRGQMSLVGPRPERPVFIEQFRSRTPRYMLRHKVQAGMTGWAQVHGWRGSTSIEKRIEHDLYYIENWSLLLDFRILLLTLFNSFRDRNAY
ncbi:MAG TPA: undecaprenyl-phosphate glucose phosphotransferase, partial [Oligoflexia bacterium]|nr:undecaprenyl-phosphate glucose phosphotransferase [Oligoflexia bacterium]